MGILSGGVPPISLNSDPISDQKMSLSTPVFRPVVHQLPGGQLFLPLSDSLKISVSRAHFSNVLGTLQAQD